MIPELAPEQQIDPPYREFMARLARGGFSGDIACDYASRLVVATDNSAFQQLPQGVLFPRDEDDIARVFTLLAEPAFQVLYIAPRGGGTSTIGCSLTAGLVLDCSRHMTRILELDAEAGRVRVQPGVVLDQLNDWLADKGLFFAPNVAPSSRATLGGMASTDGCGKGSRVYGKTSDHVLASRLVLSDGSRWTAAPCDAQTLAAIQARDDLVGLVHREVADIVERHRSEIERVFPNLSRYLSGYNLAQVHDVARGHFNLNKLICGSEGTLATVSELTLKVMPLPQLQALFALRYDSFDAALRDAGRLVQFNPTAIESLDDKVMGLARANPIYRRVRDYIENPDGSTPRAVNLVEFSAHDRESLDAAVRDLQASLDAGHGPATGHYRAESAAARAALWDLRKGGVGLLGSTPGDRKPLPFVEDTVVDPRVLPEYVRDFRAILDEYGLEYGMFGHIDVGCLHVRPALNLCDPDDEHIMREITGRVEQLARRYGGLLWNEHGKGFRSEYNPDYFGPTLYAALGRVKAAFDPHYQLNPGKIVAADTRDMPLAGMDATTRGTYNRQIPIAERRVYAKTIECNGNGACFNYNPTEVMCPSYRVTRDRLHSPKGRAEAMRAWLRLLGQSGYQPSRQAMAASRPVWLAATLDAVRGRPRDSASDFSHQVWTAMDGCLSCRACATQCPVKVDVPSFKSRFLAHYHTRHARPLGDYALAMLEPAAAALARFPQMANRAAQSSWGRTVLARFAGLTHTPLFSRLTLQEFLRTHPEYRFSQTGFARLSREQQACTVFIVQDPFTSFFDTPVVIAVLELLAHLGHRPLILPFQPNGKALQVKGFLPEFRRTAHRTAAFLQRMADLGRPLVGIEPSVTLSYREEYTKTLGPDVTPTVHLLEEWLARALPDKTNSMSDDGLAAGCTLLQHCTLAATCPASALAWQRVFAHFGRALTPAAVGCCGMSGAYGHETRHQAESRGIYDLSWAGAFDAATATAVVPGYSCRTQTRRFGNAEPLHPAQVLLAGLMRSDASQ